MDRLFHRHALRHLDTDLINRIEANGPQGRKPAPAKPSAKPPRDASTYRGLRRNADRIKGWPSAIFAKSRPLASSRFIPLNRSERWPRAKSYACARDISPSSEPVR